MALVSRLNSSNTIVPCLERCRVFRHIRAELTVELQVAYVLFSAIESQDCSKFTLERRTTLGRTFQGKLNKKEHVEYVEESEL